MLLQYSIQRIPNGVGYYTRVEFRYFRKPMFLNSAFLLVALTNPLQKDRRVLAQEILQALSGHVGLAFQIFAKNDFRCL